jgi:hypothetical protein
MRFIKRILALLGLGEHAEFIWNILDWFGLTKPINWVFYGIGSGVSGLFAAMADWPPIGIFLAVIGAGAGLSIVYAGFHYVQSTQTMVPAISGVSVHEFEDALPDLRVADSDLMIALFGSKERDKLFTGKACQLGGKILVAQIDADRGCVFVEQLHRDFKIGSRSDGLYFEPGFKHRTTGPQFGLNHQQKAPVSLLRSAKCQNETK